MISYENPLYIVQSSKIIFIFGNVDPKTRHTTCNATLKREGKGERETKYGYIRIREMNKRETTSDRGKIKR